MIQNRNERKNKTKISLFFIKKIEGIIPKSRILILKNSLTPPSQRVTTLNLIFGLNVKVLKNFPFSKKIIPNIPLDCLGYEMKIL